MTRARRDIRMRVMIVVVCLFVAWPLGSLLHALVRLVAAAPPPPSQSARENGAPLRAVDLVSVACARRFLTFLGARTATGTLRPLDIFVVAVLVFFLTA